MDKCIPISPRAIRDSRRNEGSDDRPVWEALARLPWGDINPFDYIGGEELLSIERAIEDAVLSADVVCMLRWSAPVGTDIGELQLFTRNIRLVLFPER